MFATFKPVRGPFFFFLVGTRITNVSGWSPRKQASERAETEVTSQECRNSSDFFNHPRHTFMRRRIIPWGFQLSNGMQRQVVTLLFTSFINVAVPDLLFEERDNHGLLAGTTTC